MHVEVLLTSVAVIFHFHFKLSTDGLVNFFTFLPSTATAILNIRFTTGNEKAVGR